MLASADSTPAYADVVRVESYNTGSVAAWSKGPDSDDLDGSVSRSKIGHLIALAKASTDSNVAVAATSLPSQLAWVDNHIPRYLRGTSSVRNSIGPGIKERLKDGSVSPLMIDRLLTHCAERLSRHNDSLDCGYGWIAIVGDRVLPYATQLLEQDKHRWTNPRKESRYDHEDHWYMLLRGMAFGGMAEEKLWPYIEAALASGYRGVRDGAVCAAYDLNTPRAKQLLESLAANDSDPYIRKSAGELVVDMEA